MSIRVIDGARTLDGANFTSDVAHADRANTTTTNATAHDMASFGEFIAVFQSGTMPAGGSAQCILQESNELAANFTNIAGASVNFAAADDDEAKWIAVNWKNPTRLRFVRAQVIGGGTANHVIGALGLRVQPLQGNVAADDAVTVVD